MKLFFPQLCLALFCFSPVLGFADTPRAEQYQEAYDQEYFSLRFDEARYFVEQGMYKEAEKRMIDLLKVQPNRDEARYALVSLYDKTGNSQAALKELEILEKNPEFRERAAQLRSKIEGVGRTTSSVG